MIGKNMLFRRKPNDPQAYYYLSTCKYCGQLFIKFQNKSCFCSDECRHKSKQDSKASYQRKRRKLIKDGVLISNENNYVGTGFLSKHANPDFKREYKSIRKECGRIGLKL